MSETPKIVKKVPEITPELLAENEELQVELRKRFTYDHPPFETYSHQVIRNLMADIDYIVDQIDKVDPEDAEVLETRLRTYRRDCTEWLMSIGDFATAKETAIDDNTRDMCQARIDKQNA